MKNYENIMIQTLLNEILEENRDKLSNVGYIHYTIDTFVHWLLQEYQEESLDKARAMFHLGMGNESEMSQEKLQLVEQYINNKISKEEFLKEIKGSIE